MIWFIPIFLVLVTSTYVTYTSLLGFPKVSLPQKGMYLKHYIDEPNWIYLWVLGSEDDMGTGAEEGKEIEGGKGGYTIGGDMGFYEWDFESSMAPKDSQQ